MKDVKVTNILKLYAMLLLLEGPKTGYAIIKKATAETGRKASPGQIYPFLKALQRRGCLKPRGVDSRGKIEYSLTPKGRDFVDSVLSRMGNLIDIAVRPRLSVCAHCGCRVYGGGYSERIRGKTMAFCCRFCARSFKQGG